MVYSRSFMLYFWIFCIFANASAQQLTSTLSASNRTCPGTRITFNCSITGSVSLTNLIIRWRSPQYIGLRSSLQFTTDDMMGDSEPSMINANVTAQLIYNGNRNGTPTLESQLQLTVSSDSLNSTISCHNVASGTLRDVTFYIPSVPGSPQNAEGTEVPRVDGRCVIFLTWDAPLDYDEEDIDHYIVQIPSSNIIIQTNAKAIFVSISITRCIPDIHVNVSAVDRCGRHGPSTVVVPHLTDSSTVNETAPTQPVTTPRQENQSGSLEIAVIVLSVIVGFIVVMITLCICVFCYLKRRKIHPDYHDGIEMEMVTPYGYPLYGDVSIHKPTKDQIPVSGQKQEGPLAVTYSQTIEKEQLLTLCRDGCAAEVGVFKSFLDQGVDPNFRDEDGRHPLWYACLYGKRDLVKLLLQYKADVNFKTNDGWTALDLASNKHLTDVVKVLRASSAQHSKKYLSKRILKLCREGCTAKIGVFKSLLDQGADPNSQDEDGRHPLRYASCYGKRDLVELFLQHKADVNLKTKDGWTALHLASSSGHTDVVKLLVNSGAQLDNKDKNGWTALDLASNKHHTDVVKVLRASRAQHSKKYLKEQLLTLCRDGSTAEVGDFKSLLDQGVDPNFQDEDGATPLYVASQNGHKEVVELLLDKGANVDQQDKDGATPLYVASQNGHKEVVELLLHKGANVDQQKKDGGTALRIASFDGHKDVVRLLITRGATVDIIDKDGVTPLYVASQNGHKGVVELLLDKGANVNQQNKDGFTPLYVASHNEHKEVVELLLDKGANVDQQNKDGGTALRIASFDGHIDVVRLLITRGATVDIIDKDGFTPLYVASQNGHKGVVELLIEKGANVDQQNKDGDTPLYVDSENGHNGVVELLLDKGTNVDKQTKDSQTALHLASKSRHSDVVELLDVGSGAQIDNEDKPHQTEDAV